MLFVLYHLVKKLGRNVDNFTFMEKGKCENNTSDELRSLLYPCDSDDSLELHHGSATCAPPDCTVQPEATFGNDAYTCMT
jgi:hypothetical protein